MARIRTIKPDFFTSDTVSALPIRARLTWIGLWTHCDDHGRCRDNVKLIKAAVWPLDDVSLRDIDSDLTALESAAVIYRYSVLGKSYIQVTGWTEHQKVDRPSRSPIPAPSEGIVTPPSAASNGDGDYADPPSTDTRETLARTREPASDPRVRKGREGKGGEGTRASARDSPPSERCLNHIDTPDPPPCGPCGDARRSRERWNRDRAADASAQQSEHARQRAETARLAIDACRQCDPHGLVAGRTCLHPAADASDRARRGGAAVRAALNGGSP